MAAMTAWQAFTDTASVEAGQRVLISGAGGGVGHLAVQLARHLGAHVIALASEGKHLRLQELGADETIDYRDATAVAALEGTADIALSLAASSRDAALRAVSGSLRTNDSSRPRSRTGPTPKSSTRARRSPSVRRSVTGRDDRSRRHSETGPWRRHLGRGPHGSRE